MPPISSDAWAGIVGAVLGGVAGAFLAFVLAEWRQHSKRKRLAGSLGKLFKIEVERIVAWMEVQEDGPFTGPKDIRPRTRFFDEYGPQVLDVFAEQTGAELAKFYDQFHEFTSIRERLMSRGPASKHRTVRIQFGEARRTTIETAKVLIPKLVHAGC